MFILLAGWGLVRGDYLLPYYDITFTRMERADRYKQRMPKDMETYEDFCQLSADGRPLVCFVGKEYLPLLRKLTDSIPCEKVIFFATNNAPDGPACKTFQYRKFTNWQYQCAKDFLAGKLAV